MGAYICHQKIYKHKKKRFSQSFLKLWENLTLTSDNNSKEQFCRVPVFPNVQHMYPQYTGRTQQVLDPNDQEQ